MLARTLCFTLQGVDGRPVWVETDVRPSSGDPHFLMVGLPDTAVRESRDRVSGALRNSGYALPYGSITVNLSPADLKKEGSAFDLPIAVSLIAASRQAALPDLDRVLLLGELSLDGTLTPVRGVLSMVIAAHQAGIESVVLPKENTAEVQSLTGMRVYPAQSLSQAVNHLSGKEPLLAQAQLSYADTLRASHPALDLSLVKGQQGARRALEVAAAGGHNLLMIGVPGSGKTMLARCLPGILPPMTFEEACETTRIHSVAGLLKPGQGLMTERPFRTPHHAVSAPALVGGGSDARPGEISLAHNGVLFLDELPEYAPQVLEALRQPLEDGFATISRVRARARYLSRCMLVAGMNPCPCGYYGSRTRQCRCGEAAIRRYLGRVSGPLLDRIDLQVEVDAVPVSEINASAPAEDSETVRRRVQAARLLQQRRLAPARVYCNAQMDGAALRELCPLSDAAQQLLARAVDKMGMSMRGYTRVIKAARTIADLAGEEAILPAHIAEAIQYRALDSKYWGH
ncbi:MAG: YifB family Mg chelatase-like AAA ATPase [Clostridia bacterium]|nr:YifB family Mg chelatase-like AAA ATPase [Clostridia bacterium]